MAFATWLPAVLRQAGLKVVEVPGWEKRSTWTSGFTPRAVIIHHTGPWSFPGILHVLEEGRVDLDGPLAQLGAGPDGTIYVVAAGRANHNGYGTYGNDAIGIEAFNTGAVPWPPAMFEAVARATAAIVRYTGLPLDRVLGHKESDPGRKPDPSQVDMAQFRARVHAILTGANPEEEELMAAKDDILKAVAEAEERIHGHVQDVHDSLVARIGVSAKEAKNGEDLQALVKRLLPTTDA